MREGSLGGANGLTWLAADHLNSTSLTINPLDYTQSTEIRYSPWGQTRYWSGTPTTDRKYTGQREEAALGLYYYNARWYDPALSHFIMADTIIPGAGAGNNPNAIGYLADSNYSALTVDYHENQFLEQLNQENLKRLNDPNVRLPGVPTNPLAFDRFAYVMNNPIRYNDPTGHAVACDGANSSDCGGYDTPISDAVKRIPGKADHYSNVSKVLDISAVAIDLYAAGVVTVGAIGGAGVALPFALGGPEVPAVTGLAGAGIAELAVQPLLQASTGISFVSAFATYIADTKQGTTIIEKGVISSSTANSFSIAYAGAMIPEAYINLGLSVIAVTNDYGLTSLPWPNLQ